MTTKEEIWQEWIGRYIDTENPIPLFETDENLNSEFKYYGNDDRRILKRSEEMEALVRGEGRKVINDWHTADDTYDGLIYLMYWLEDGEVIPLYVGKAGKYGRDGEGLSANLRGLRGSSTGKFARWGDGHYYHIGNLSAIIFDHDKNQKQKYRKWADRLFSGGRQLRQPTYFWTKAWKQDDIGLFHDFEVPLEQLEYQIIGVASDLYPDLLLNSEGA
ncbi:hypothetical protein SAMN04488065_1880 [Haloplanus vescus]|uniref:Uncharacterized protein n=1 Tax=Haloplanus vescus TaxID=555874 RepID=A0A1H3YIK7_9EURY|nr:hypothetical protein [Haloplanus vescus]SEA10854.1 hypothetical protein SAMN04488065_1880 [Haloplanus vescus]